MKGIFTFLGTGGSAGVPMAGCRCFVCTHAKGKQVRLRCAATVEVGGKVLLIDAGPDIRQQALNQGLMHIDGVILTHGHYDHIGGLDDLKVYAFNDFLPFLSSKELFEEIQARFYYLLDPGKFFSWQWIEKPFGQTVFQGIPIGFVSYMQQRTKVLGFQIGDLAYISDIKEFDMEIFNFLKGVKTLVISAVRVGGSPMHFSVQEALDFHRQLGSSSLYLTHIGHEMDADVEQMLPKEAQLAYDGLKIPFEMVRDE